VKPTKAFPALALPSTVENGQKAEGVMKDFYLGTCCLRVFYRGWRHPLPYCFHRWGFYGFGAGPIGCMLWLKTGNEAVNAD
jgi:hypothetical protein